jgi:hypothetical protein
VSRGSFSGLDQSLEGLKFIFILPSLENKFHEF